MKRFLHFAILAVFALQLSITLPSSAQAATSGQISVLQFESQDKISESPCLTTCLRSFREIIKCNTNKMVIEQIAEDEHFSKNGLKKVINRLFKRN